MRRLKYIGEAAELKEELKKLVEEAKKLRKWRKKKNYKKIVINID